jgi:hypothetical protein
LPLPLSWALLLSRAVARGSGVCVRLDQAATMVLVMQNVAMPPPVC